MIKKVLSKLFKKELDELSQSKQREYESYIRYAKLYERENGFINQLLNNNPDMLILHIARNKNDFIKVAGYLNDTICIYDKKHTTEAARLFFEFKWTKKDNEYPSIRITDIQTYENRGDGSIAMHALVKIAKQLHATQITGMLSPEDEEHRDRRTHYYDKFGFEIKPEDKVVILTSDKFDDALKVPLTIS